MWLGSLLLHYSLLHFRLGNLFHRTYRRCFLQNKVQRYLAPNSTLLRHLHHRQLHQDILWCMAEYKLWLALVPNSLNLARFLHRCSHGKRVRKLPRLGEYVYQDSVGLCNNLIRLATFHHHRLYQQDNLSTNHLLYRRHNYNLHKSFHQLARHLVFLLR